MGQIDLVFYIYFQSTCSGAQQPVLLLEYNLGFKRQINALLVTRLMRDVHFSRTNAQIVLGVQITRVYIYGFANSHVTKN